MHHRIQRPIPHQMRPQKSGSDEFFTSLKIERENAAAASVAMHPHAVAARMCPSCEAHWSLAFPASMTLGGLLPAYPACCACEVARISWVQILELPRMWQAAAAPTDAWKSGTLLTILLCHLCIAAATLRCFTHTECEIAVRVARIGRLQVLQVRGMRPAAAASADARSPSVPSPHISATLDTFCCGPSQ